MSKGNSMAKTTPAEDLREQVELKAGPEDKTVIRFEYCYDTSVKKKHRVYYTFSAVWIEATGYWYASGQGGGVPREAKNDDMMKLLASGNVKTASVATEFTSFKP